MKTKSTNHPIHSTPVKPIRQKTASKEPQMKAASIPAGIRKRTLEMLDIVEVTRDQDKGQLKKGMTGAILEVNSRGPRKSYFIEVIHPSVLGTVSEDDIKPVDE